MCRGDSLVISVECLHKGVYLETTVIGHFAGRLHLIAAVLARQQLTQQWWDSASNRYLLFVSDLVLVERADGDGDAASERLRIVDGIDLLQTSAASNALAAELIAAHAVPQSEPRDALHIALAGCD